MMNLLKQSSRSIQRNQKKKSPLGNRKRNWSKGFNRGRMSIQCFGRERLGSGFTISEIRKRGNGRQTHNSQKDEEKAKEGDTVQSVYQGNNFLDSTVTKKKDRTESKKKKEKEKLNDSINIKDLRRLKMHTPFGNLKPFPLSMAHTPNNNNRKSQVKSEKMVKKMNQEVSNQKRQMFKKSSFGPRQPEVKKKTNPVIGTLSKIEGSGSKHFSKNSNPSLIVEQIAENIDSPLKKPKHSSANFRNSTIIPFKSSSKKRQKRTSITAPYFSGSFTFNPTDLKKFASTSNLLELKKLNSAKLKKMESIKVNDNSLQMYKGNSEKDIQNSPEQVKRRNSKYKFPGSVLSLNTLDMTSPSGVKPRGQKARISRFGMNQLRRQKTNNSRIMAKPNFENSMMSKLNQEEDNGLMPLILNKRKGDESSLSASAMENGSRCFGGFNLCQNRNLDSSIDSCSSSSSSMIINHFERAQQIKRSMIKRQSMSVMDRSVFLRNVADIDATGKELDQLEDYNFLGGIGSGSFAKVMKARNKITHKLYVSLL